jgi:NAD(P)-dependent dehydrogenase (short-subunit alcohol dehydrogenase family)
MSERGVDQMSDERRVVVITAGGDGMGRAAALRFGRSGSHVVVTDIDGQKAAAVEEEIRAAGGAASSAALDVRDTAALRELFDRIAGEFGVINVLYNNAGVPGPSGTDMSEAEWAVTVEINLRGAFYATSFAEPLLRRGAPDAAVVFTASVAGLVGSPLSPLYSATKGGIVTLMKSLALSLAPAGIRVNAVCPGPTDTAMLPRFVSRDDEATAEERHAMLVRSVPMGRTAQPDEIAAAVHFLASPDASFITGVALPVDGGYLAR